ncbi:hypothetical protein ACWF82_30120 [Nocardia sp. NPDC055053]
MSDEAITEAQQLPPLDYELEETFGRWRLTGPNPAKISPAVKSVVIHAPQPIARIELLPGPGKSAGASITLPVTEPVTGPAYYTVHLESGEEWKSPEVNLAPPARNDKGPAPATFPVQPK